MIFCWVIFRNTSHIIVKGLGRIGSGTQASESLLRSRISSVLALVGANVDVRVKSVIVFPGAKPVYKVELESAAVVKALLSGHSQYTRRRDPVARPQGLENVFLYNCVTPGTRIRISLLRVSV